MKPEQDRIKTVLTETVGLLCKSSLSYRDELKIEAVIGVTVDVNDVFIVHINESFTPEGGMSSAPAEKSVAVAPLGAHEVEQEFQAPRMPYAMTTSSAVKRMRIETDSMPMLPSAYQATQFCQWPPHDGHSSNSAGLRLVHHSNMLLHVLYAHAQNVSPCYHCWIVCGIKLPALVP